MRCTTLRVGINRTGSWGHGSKNDSKAEEMLAKLNVTRKETVCISCGRLRVAELPDLAYWQLTRRVGHEQGNSLNET